MYGSNPSAITLIRRKVNHLCAIGCIATLRSISLYSFERIKLVQKFRRYLLLYLDYPDSDRIQKWKAKANPYHKILANQGHGTHFPFVCKGFSCATFSLDWSITWISRDSSFGDQDVYAYPVSD